MESSTELTVTYNSRTYNLREPTSEIKVIKTGRTFKFKHDKTSRHVVKFSYKDTIIESKSNDILLLYVVMQHVFDVSTLIDLSKKEWDYSCWNVEISSDKHLSDQMRILNYLLNLKDQFNKPIEIKKLEEQVKLRDNRGWGGERPREVYYKLGFPLFTPHTLRTLKNSQRLFECPFPIGYINPDRKAIVQNTTEEKKCFTCGIEEGDIDKFGNLVHFQKGHFEPHIRGGSSAAGNQCDWCNTFYGDRITWNVDTGKPTFNLEACMRKASQKDLIRSLKKIFPFHNFQDLQCQLAIRREQILD